jgi:hypothetical protein
VAKLALEARTLTESARRHVAGVGRPKTFFLTGAAHRVHSESRNLPCYRSGWLCAKCGRAEGVIIPTTATRHANREIGLHLFVLRPARQTSIPRSSAPSALTPEVFPFAAWTIDAINRVARAWERVYNTIRPH